MKVLMISSDANILKEGSETWKRVQEYKKHFEELRALVTGGRLFDFWRVYREAKKILRSGGQWVITSQDPFEHGLIANALAEKFNLPFQVQVHTDFLSPFFARESLKNRIRVWIAKFILPEADGIRVVSERIKKSILSSRLMINEERITILPIYTDLEKFKNAQKDGGFSARYSGKSPLILMVSRLTKEKNIWLAVEAMEEILKTHPDAALVIVGDGPERQNIEFKIKKLKLEKSVFLEPRTDNPAGLYKSADLFLMTSNYEGYGRTAVEAAAAGIPVIMTDVGISIGATFPVGDKKALAGKINEVDVESQNKFLKTLPSDKKTYICDYVSSLRLKRINRFLFVTQKVDMDDDVLGVYHEWSKRLAGQFTEISVICLYQGRLELPANVKVYSLGKEEGRSRVKYVWRFFKYIWSLRKKYDGVFVHMNPEYVLLGWKLWKLSGKKIAFWYNHPLGGWKARAAIALADKVFYTSPFAFASRYKKAVQMPVGIDADLFRPIPSLRSRNGREEQSHKNSILYLGRLSPIKYVDVLIEAAWLLDSQGVDFKLTIAGEPSKESEEEYAETLKKRAEPLVKKGKIIFIGSVPNRLAPGLYNTRAIYVNLTPTGSFDKTIIEAMACEQLVVASNKSVSDVLPEFLRFREKDGNDLARVLRAALELENEKKQEIGRQLRKYVLGRHNLDTLTKRLAKELNKL